MLTLLKKPAFLISITLATAGVFFVLWIGVGYAKRQQAFISDSLKTVEHECASLKDDIEDLEIAAAEYENPERLTAAATAMLNKFYPGKVFVSVSQDRSAYIAVSRIPTFGVPAAPGVTASSSSGVVAADTAASSNHPSTKR